MEETVISLLKTTISDKRNNIFQLSFMHADVETVFNFFNFRFEKKFSPISESLILSFQPVSVISLCRIFKKSFIKTLLKSKCLLSI